jgi:hypothetical protein
MMEQFTFRVPPSGFGPFFFFDVNARNEDEAVDKARRLLCEQSPDGHLHVDLTFGLTAGRLIVPESAVSREGIVEIRKDTKPF